MISHFACQSALCIIALLLASQLLMLTSADDGQNVRLPARFGKRAESADSASASSNVPLLKMLMRGGSAEPAYLLNNEAVHQQPPLYMLVPVKSASSGYLMKHNSAEETPIWK